MKNIHILPTDKPSRLFIDVDDNKLKITIPIGGEHMMNQNIYITNDEEIKYGNYRYSLIQNNIVFVTGFTLKVNKEYWKLNNHIHKKIILTTDEQLIKDGVQAIDDEFLEWFVKNPSCEYVETYSLKEGNEELGYHHYKYEIVIPKEEPKQENCCTPVGQIKRYVDCHGCDRKPKQEQEVCNHCSKTLREQMKGCGEITCYRQFLHKQETLEERETYWDLTDAKAEQNNTIDLDAYAEGVQDGVKWQQEKQADFVIGFLEFIEGTYSYSNIFDHWYLHSDTSKTYSKKQLLEVYLKRNKL